MPTLLGFDLETHLIQPGLLTPPGVCGSFFDGTEGWLETFPDALDTLEGALRPGCTLAVANGVFDFAVSVAEPKGGAHKGRPRLLRAIFEKIERGEVFDVQLAAALNYVADGKLFKDPVTGGPMQFPPDPITGKTKQAHRYNLEIVLYLLTGRADAKVNDVYRLRYHEFDGKPISEWPIEAQTYPVDDARNQWTAASILQAKGQNLGKLERHPWTHLTHQTRAAWAMHLMSTWGLRTNGESVAKLKAEVTAEYDRTFEQFKTCGLIYWDEKHKNDEPEVERATVQPPPEALKNGVWDGKRGKWKDDGTEVKRRVILAYGGDPKSQCGECLGTGHTPCEICRGTGKAESLKRPGKIITCHGCKGKPAQCKTCGATGIAVPEAVGRTDAGGIKADRDTLSESDDPMLEEFGERSENEKLRNTYVPFLEQGVTRPVNVRGNVMTDTCRASFEGLIQLLPRAGGVRECFESREGTAYCSVDYSAGELSTLAQVNLWQFGYSRMAEAINAGRDLHSTLGAQMLGITYDEFKALVTAKDFNALLVRFACKAGNFGFGGLMGAPKFVLTQRKAKSFPNDPLDPSKGNHGSMCRLGGREVLPCGTEKITTWWGHLIAPVCKQCVDFSDELKKMWLTTWEEMKEYFAWVKGLPGIPDGIGVMTSPGTGYVRGGMNASQAANHPFQHLMAMGAKHALWNVCKECYLDESSPLFGSRPVVFAHDEIICEIPLQNLHAAAYRQRDIMVASMREFVPDVAMAAEPAAATRWYKAMQAVHVDGKLIPWTPGMKIEKGVLISRAA